MTTNDLVAVLRLQHIPNIGDINAKKLIRQCGSPQAVFESKREHLLKIDGIGTYTLQQLFDKKHLEAAQQELLFIKKNKIAYTYFLDPEYPKYLKYCVDSPLLLFKRGAIDLADRKIISIVGTRNITGYGTAFCERFIEEIAPLDLQTIGCLAHGLNQIYPKVHKAYMPAIEANGGFLTEFWSTSHPERENFLRRNRIIAGMAEATVVIESAAKGGSLVTADIAHSYNRDVFAVPGRAEDTYSLGCNNLIKQQKAHMLTSAADLIYLLAWDIKTKDTPSVQKQLFVELDDTEQYIYTYLQKDGKQLLDTIALQCSIPVFKASSTLLNMEMKGVIRPLPGKLFEAV